MLQKPWSRFVFLFSIMEFSSPINRESQDIVVPHPGSCPSSSGTILGLYIDVCPFFDKELHELRSCHLGSEYENCSAVSVLGIDVSPRVYEELRYFQFLGSRPSSVHEGCSTPDILGI